MSLPQLSLILLPGRFAVCKLDPGDSIPGWAAGGSFLSLTRTSDELSIVCDEASIPECVKCARDWCCLRVAGAMDFSAIGVLASLVGPLAQAQISVFAISTFDTDYLLMREHDLPNALDALRRQGHTLSDD
jgi:hypothetical protein